MGIQHSLSISYQMVIQINAKLFIRRWRRMNELNIKISDAVTEVEVILERIYVLSNDLDQGYFEQDIKHHDRTVCHGASDGTFV